MDYEIEIIAIYRDTQHDIASIDVKLTEADCSSRYYVNVVSFEELIRKHQLGEKYFHSRPLLIVDKLEIETLTAILQELAEIEDFRQVLSPLDQR